MNPVELRLSAQDTLKGGIRETRRAVSPGMLIRRRPSAATLVAIVTTLVIGSQTGLAAGSGRELPRLSARSRSPRRTARASRSRGRPRVNSDSVVGYGVYLNGAQVGTQTPDQVKRWRDRDTLSYTMQAACLRHGLHGRGGCGRSWRSTTRRSPRRRCRPSACPDATAPSAPSGMRQVAATENSVMLAWSPSSDNVGVVEYGLYASGRARLHRRATRARRSPTSSAARAI